MERSYMFTPKVERVIDLAASRAESAKRYVTVEDLLTAINEAEQDSPTQERSKVSRFHFIWRDDRYDIDIELLNAPIPEALAQLLRLLAGTPPKGEKVNNGN